MCIRDRLQVGQGRESVDWMAQLLSWRDRRRGAPTFSPDGLYLSAIEYPDEMCIRDRGCSMCLAMNADRLEPGERCASTSNRNFEGRQGQGGRTYLVSPAMAAAAAVAGHFVDVRTFR